MGYKSILFMDDMMIIKADKNSCSYHEVEIQSEIDGEFDNVIIDKNSGKITIRFKEDKRQKEYDKYGDYIKPLDKDKDFEITVKEEELVND